MPELIRFDNWRELKIAYFDLETTSFEPSSFNEHGSYEEWIEANKDRRIVEFGCQIRRGDEIIESYYQFINPGMPIPPESTEVHKITDEVVKDCPTFEECCDDIIGFLAKADIVSAYNGFGFDRPFLEFEVSRVSGKKRELTMPFVDPFILYYEYKTGKSASLLSAAKSFGCGQAADIAYGDMEAHRTEPDVNMLADVLFKLGARLPQSIDELLELQEKLHTSQKAYFSKRKTKSKTKR